MGAVRGENAEAVPVGFGAKREEVGVAFAAVEFGVKREEAGVVFVTVELGVTREAAPAVGVNREADVFIAVPAAPP